MTEVLTSTPEVAGSLGTRPGISRKDCLFATAGGLALTFAYPPFPTGFLAYFALAPLLYALKDKTPKQHLILAYLFGLAFHATALFWTWRVTLPGTVAMILILALYWAVPFWFFGQSKKLWGRRAYLLLPFLLVGLEYFRTLGELAFPWTNLSYTQSYYPAWLQLLPFAGDASLSFWIVILNLLFFYALESSGKKRWLGFAAAFLFWFAPGVYGARVLENAKSEPVMEVALLQGNIDSWSKWDAAFTQKSFDTYRELVFVAAARGADFLVWPETAAPCYLLQEPNYLYQIMAMAQVAKKEMLVGTLAYRTVGSNQYQYYNAAYHFDTLGQPSIPYGKLHLVPFGETIPFSGQVRVLKDIHVGQADFTPGDSVLLLQSSFGPYAALICYEVVFPDLVRRFVLKGAKFLVNVTNDGWYGRTNGPYQHERIALFRAVENRISLVRAANSGISAAFDPYGRVISEGKLFKKQIVMAEIPLRNETTFYARWGDFFPQGCFLISLVAGFSLAQAHVKRRFGIK
ncbi:MAG TPA: apolipoprotein N-acyltransferase [candidate division Zixibacteria bacterium]|nr:apolipoprotein N-acyltransferase [candidate division Zixibacteria bacterium]